MTRPEENQMLRFDFRFDFPRGTCFFPCTDEPADPSSLKSDEAIECALAVDYPTAYLPYDVMHGDDDVSLVLEVIMDTRGREADIELPCAPAERLLENAGQLAETTAGYRVYVPLEDEEAWILENYKLLAAVTPDGNLFICEGRAGITRAIPLDAAIPAHTRLKAATHPIGLYGSRFQRR